MVYTIFLYKTRAVCASAPAIGAINTAVSKDENTVWERTCADNCMEQFDAENILLSIKTQFTDLITKQSMCNALIRYSPSCIGYIYIATSYALAPDVLPQLYAIATKNDLVLYDAETDKTFYRELVDNSLICMKLRRQHLNDLIQRHMTPIWSIRRLSFCSGGTDKSCSYAVILRKDPSATFQERTKQFFDLLSHNITEQERLLCENRCFTVTGEHYEITYVLEGYKKHADRNGYVKNGVPSVDLMRRCSMALACKWMKNCSEREVNDIYARMNFFEMQQRYPNPSERFIASVNITKWQRKQVFDIRYSGIGYYGSEIIFHLLPDKYHNDSESISVLKIEENSASFILPFVADEYPDIYEYYYASNHLPPKMMERIVNRLKWAKDTILHDTFDPVLEPYTELFDLYVLLDSDASRLCSKIEDRKQFMYENRYKIAYLYDVFIQWTEAQLSWCSTGCGLLFNIQGP